MGTGGFAASFESLRTHDVPDWFADAKLGIFVHWTAPTIAAFAPITDSPFELAAAHGWEHALANMPYVEWYQNSLSIPGSPVARHHETNWPGVPYEELVARFVDAAERWEPALWADAFERAGARYAVFVTKHHDGVTLWPSRTPNPLHGPTWSLRRDAVSELAQEVRARGMRYGVYYSGGLDWTFGGLPMDSATSMLTAIPQSAEYCAYADGHWRELIDLVGPDVLWNDIAYPSGARPMELFADFYNGNRDGLVNDRFDFLGVRAGTAHADFVTPEYATAPDVEGRAFEVCRGIGHSFGYNAWETDADHLDPDELVRTFVDIVAHGGNLLLNVGPTATGEIPAAQARRLDALGWWLQVNGEAIYGTRPADRVEGTTAGGLPVRYTASDATTFAIVQGTPLDRTVELDVRPAAGSSVRRLGDAADAEWTPTDRGCRITLPTPCAAGPAVAFRLTPTHRE